ncbi:RNA polymerase III transcription factor IIIC subunit-domain-containing protein [Podospora didyma]|uniref:RNA polymerase III transcription factor IIIC subunit-domain-containing protein n=1 Tax=Podospora didyma TaxID=330526 RepID=A0AAE0K500_9PEZI|nr:RNA polymerase III transcription factor IIIC subunit-domain-containing protein [Podospora didyma]
MASIFDESFGDDEHAPIYTVPRRRLGALEHPMIVKNVDKAIKTFGQNYALQAVLDSASPQISVPLYLRCDNPTSRPLTSHNALTHNVVLKITVPKRTGRKRKRGTNGPFEGEVQPLPDDSTCPAPGEVLSKDRLDDPKLLRRKLRDNVGKYTVEPIGILRNTHRYRGLADFQYALGGSKFMTHFVEKILPGDVGKVKEFSLKPGIEAGTGIDLIPPPNFTNMNLPFGYNYAQNPYTKEVSPGAASSGSEPMSEDQEYTRVVNVTSRVPAAGYFIAHDEYPVPSGPRRQPNMNDPQVAMIMTEMRAAMEERPIWTRRSMWNRLGSKFEELPKSGSLVRHCLQYAGYQFKGGPWRDALIKYGLDPRSDPKYRIYQTLIFKLHKTRIGTVGRSWQSVRRNEVGVTNFGKYWLEIGDDPAARDTHIFNGQAFSTDGKVWQVCDITDPLLANLFAKAEVRTDCDVEISGFYHRVLWSVAKAIMKCKMLAIRFERNLTNEDFKMTLEAVQGPNDGGDGGGGTSIGISLPDLQLTPSECEQLRGKKMRPGVKPGRDRWIEKRKKTHYRVRIPIKQAEEREAEKMIRLISQGRSGTAGKSDSDAAALDPKLHLHTDGDGPGVRDGEAIAEMNDESGGEKEEDEEASGSFQELLDDLEEEDSDDEDSQEEEDMEEDELEDHGPHDPGRRRGSFDMEDDEEQEAEELELAEHDGDEEGEDEDVTDDGLGDSAEGEYDSEMDDGVGYYDEDDADGFEGRWQDGDDDEDHELSDIDEQGPSQKL